jgi:hypothetical protein
MPDHNALHLPFELVSFENYPDGPDDLAFINRIQIRFQQAIDGVLDPSPAASEKSAWHQPETVERATRLLFSHFGALLVNCADDSIMYPVLKDMATEILAIVMLTAQSNFNLGANNAAKELATEIASGQITLTGDSQRLFDALLQRQRRYLPNKKYTDEMFEYFQQAYVRQNSQTPAYEETATEFGLDVHKQESFLVQYRLWSKSKLLNKHK